MKVEFKDSIVIVSKEQGDKPIYKETQLYYEIKKKLKEQGYDVIKRLAAKDGNLVDDRMYYIRERKYKYAIYDNFFAIRNLAEEYRKEGIVKLTIVR